MEIFSEEFKEKVKKHYRKRKFLYIGGSILVIGVVGFVIGRKSKKSHCCPIIVPSTPENEMPSASDLRRYDKLLSGWPLPNYKANEEISTIPVISKWKHALGAIGINTLFDLVKYIRNSGVRNIEYEPGMGKATIRAIDNFFRNNSSNNFHNLYF